MSLFSLLILFIVLLLQTNEAYKPNILFIMCDSMDGRNMDPTALQYSLMDMPNLRTLALKGSIFTNHYASSPQCVPGRTTLFSGRRTDQQRGFNNGMGWAMSINGSRVDPACQNYYNKATCERWGKLQNINYTIFDGLIGIGYDVYLYGKVDVGGDIIQEPGQENASVNGFHNGPNIGSGIPITTRSANINKPTKGIPKADENDNNVHHEDFVITSHCQEKLRDIAKSNSNKPWFMYCSINIPHPPYQTNATWLKSVDQSNIPLPIWLNEDEFHPADQYQSISKNVWGNFTDTDIQNVRATYYAMNVETDYLLGTVLNQSYELGWNESNTIIIFTSDHGDMNMEHRQQLKNSMYEGSARIPLFMAGPNIKKHNIVYNVTATIDILPTIIDFTETEIPSFLNGYSLTSMLYDNDNINNNNILIDHPNYITSQYHSNMGNTGSFMVRKGEWKYIQFGHYLEYIYKNYSAQLFNLKTDPNEINDISSENQDIVQEMESILQNEFNYEYIDCIAKQNDFLIFEEFQWNLYNETELKNRLSQAYQGFDEKDWESIVKWRNVLLNDTKSSTTIVCEQHAEKWLKPITDKERITLF